LETNPRTAAPEERRSSRRKPKTLKLATFKWSST
jgi:hypothetical protein